MSFRSWLRAPVVTGGILLCTATGVGVATLGVTMALGMAAPRMPYPVADRLYELWQTGIRSAPDARYEGSARLLSEPLARALGERTDLFEAVLPYTDVYLRSVEGQGDLRGSAAAHDAIPRLGLRLHLGRSFTPEEDVAGQGQVMVLTHPTWRDAFGADPSVVGRVLTFTAADVRQSYTVVGVLDSVASFPDPTGFYQDVLVPLGALATQAGIAGGRLQAVAILAPGVPIGRARAAVEAIGAQHAAADREAAAARPARRPYVTPEAPARAHIGRYHGTVVGNIEIVLTILLGLSLSVLAIASLNVATLTLARTTARRVELGVRTALGAGARRLAAVLMGEVLALVLLGGAGGALVAMIALAQLRARFGPQAGTTFAAPDGRALAAALGMTLLAGLGAAALPALQLLRSDPMTALRKGRVSWGAVAGEGGLRRVLALQIAATTFLCVGAGYFVGSAVELQRVDRGFEPASLDYALLSHGGTDQGSRAAVLADLLAEARALPGVSAASAGALPLRSSTAMDTETVQLEGTTLRAAVWVNPVLEGWLETMGIPLLEGRTISADEARTGAPVAVVSRVLAETAWPGQSALGRRLRVGTDETLVEVIGVAAEIRLIEAVDIIRQLYVPYALRPDRETGIVVRVGGDGRAGGALAGLAIAPGASVVLTESGTISEGLRQGAAGAVGIATFFVAFSMLGLLMAATGMYGVMSYTMGRRRHELGVRLALGASPRGILRFSLREALGPLAVGTAAGAGLGVLLGFAMRAQLFGLSPLAPAVLVPAAAGILLVGLGAALQPALGAAATDPAIPLRSE